MREALHTYLARAALEKGQASCLQPIIFSQKFCHTVPYGTTGQMPCQYATVWLTYKLASATFNRN